MTDKLTTILTDLYELDPSLKKHEVALMQIIKRIMESRPDTKFDKAFARRLRNELVAHTSTVTKPERNYSLFSMFSFSHTALMERVTVGVSGALIATILFVTFFSASPRFGLPFKSSQEITKLASNAFGSLSGVRDGKGLGSSAETISATAPNMGFGGGGGGGIASPMMADSKMIAPNPVSYTFTYVGDAITDDAIGESLDVYRRERGEAARVGAGGLLDLNSFKTINFSSFGNVSVRNIELMQNQQFGYAIQINTEEGSVTINQNWDQWPNPGRDCRDDACFAQYRVKESDILSDDTLISLAQRFVEEHNIDVSAYGAPEVADDWRTWYAQAENKADYYFPEILSVRYPVRINGEPVYDEGGAPIGLMININVREKKVSGLWQLTTQSYARSAYEAASADAVLTYAEKGGQQPYYMYGQTERSETIELGTPTQSLVRLWKYDAQTYKSDELYVPAYLFPIINAPKDSPYTYQKYIIVPLVKELLEQNQDQSYPRPMPLDTSVSEPIAEPAIQTREAPIAQ